MVGVYLSFKEGDVLILLQQGMKSKSRDMSGSWGGYVRELGRICQGVGE